MINILEKFANWMIKRGSCASLRLSNQLYLERFYLFRSENFAILLHRFHGPDDRYLHCHPWNNFSLILTGGYEESRFDGRIKSYGPGDFSFRQAEVFHRISKIKNPGKTWTLFITGKRKRIWGEIIQGVWNPVTSRLDEGMKGYVLPRKRTITSTYRG